MSDPLWPMDWLQQTSLPCFSLSPIVCSNLCPLSWWCYLSHPNFLLFLLLQSFPASGFSNESALPIRWPKYWSFSFSPSMNIQVWFPLGLTDLISFLSRGLSGVFSSTIWKPQLFGAQPSLWSNSHIHTRLLEKPQLWLSGVLLAK